MPEPASPAPPELRRRPRFFYGWVMLPITTVGVVATSPAQTYGVSMFNESFRQALGLSHTQLTGAYMLGTFLASLPLTYVGGLMDRYGPRATLSVVVIFFGLACMATARVTGLVTLFMAFFLLRLLGQGALGLISGNTLALWFNRRLGRANAIRSLGTAAAIATVPPLNLWLIHTVGWRWAYALLGLSVWAMMLPLLAFFFRNRPEDVGQSVDRAAPPPGEPVAEGAAEGRAPAAPEPDFTLREAWRTRAYWIAGGATALWAMMGTGALFNLIPIFAAHGFTEAHAASTFTTFAATLAVVQLVGGVLADFLPLNFLLAAAMVCLSLAMLFLWGLEELWMVYAFAMALGCAQGLTMAIKSPLWLRYYGRAHLGKVRGSISTLMVAGSSVGPFLIGAAYDTFHGYSEILAAFVLIPIPVAFLALFATPPPHSPRGRGGS